ncbi:MAG TPA: hypothetical protein VIT91_16590 [Chthoniobacterales bacterium]
MRKAFFENCRWLVLNLMFLKLRSEQGEEITLTVGEKEMISGTAVEVAEELWSICETQGFVSRRAGPLQGMDAYEQVRHFRSVFSAAADCRHLRNAYLAKTAEAGPKPVAAPTNQNPALLPSPTTT